MNCLSKSIPNLLEICPSEPKALQNQYLKQIENLQNNAYRNVLFATCLGHVYTGTLHLRHLLNRQLANNAYRNALFTTFLGHVYTGTLYLRHFWDLFGQLYTGTYYLRHFWATCIPERIIYDTFGPHVYWNVLFTTLLSHMYTGTYYLRPFWPTLYRNV